jgi:predicted component of type VI protein secretion system
MMRRDEETLLEAGWCLIASEAAFPGLRLVFGDTELSRAYPGLVIGRDPALCDRVIDDATISHRHCRFSAREQRLLIEDLNSLNGTRLGGRDLAPFKPIAVDDGATLLLGRLKLVVRRIAPAGASR